jgi:hypothetical protein
MRPLRVSLSYPTVRAADPGHGGHPRPPCAHFDRRVGSAEDAPACFEPAVPVDRPRVQVVQRHPLTFPDVASSSTASTTTLSSTDVGPSTNPTSHHRHRAVHLGPPRAFRERHNPCDRRVGAPLPAQASTCRQAVGALDVGLVAQRRKRALRPPRRVGPTPKMRQVATSTTHAPRRRRAQVQGGQLPCGRNEQRRDCNGLKWPSPESEPKEVRVIDR